MKAKKFAVPFFCFILLAGISYAGCSYSDSPSTPTTLTLDATNSYSITGISQGGCTASCYAPECAADADFWGRNELCNQIQCGGDCCQSGSCCVLGSKSNAECSATTSQMAAIVSCDMQEVAGWSGCGTLENSMFTKVCPTVTGSYTFNVTNISCSGAGSGGANSLQWNISNNLSIPGSSMKCNTTSSNDAYSTSLTGGTCYYVSFDGNFGSSCTFDFSIAGPSAAPVTLIGPITIAQSDYKGIVLNWETASESNSKQFIIKRTGSQITKNSLLMDTGLPLYEQIGTVPSLNSSTGGKYEFKDTDISAAGVYIYQLYEEDISGILRFEGQVETYIDAPEKFDVVSAYPNPASTLLNINYTLDKGGLVKFTIYNLLGQQVYYATDDKDSGGIYTKQLLLSRLKPGTYLYKVETDGRKSEGKFVKL